MNKISLLITITLVILVLTGCAPEPQYTATQPMCRQSSDKAAAMKTAEDVLTDMHFSIDKSDAASGYISTRPLTGAQSFEFWRKDNIGVFNTAEANLHTVRRIVELDFTDNGGQLCIQPTVTVERMSLPNKEVHNTSRMASMFSRNRGTLQELNLYPQQRAGMDWVELGRDGQLEKEILRRLNIKF